jgi:23S rRNA (uracil1939-C5)-methyltransferase
MPPLTTNESKQVASIEVEVEKLVYGGEGLARVDGQVMLIPYVLPRERVATRPERVKTGLLRGWAQEVLEAAPQRVVPRCEYFANCGGCHYQHAEYSFQLEQKREILRETLRRLGGIGYEGEIRVLSGDPWNYRNRIQLHFSNREAGFHKAGSHALCAIDHCYISSPVLVDVIGKLQAAAKEPQWPEFLRSLEVFTNETDVQLNIVDSVRPVAARFFEWCETFLPLLAKGPIVYAAAGHKYRISRGSFFQVNRFLMDALVEEVLGDSQGTRAVDLYAGVGLFSLPLAKRFASVEAVERGGPAYRDLEWNAGESGSGVLPVKASAEEFLRALTEPPDLIVADPPRAGLGKEATAELLRIKAPHLTLVSCDPATLARDVKKLLEAYRVERLTVVDLFPQTYHFEVIAHLALSS